MSGSLFRKIGPPTYKRLLQVNNDTDGVDGTVRPVLDGEGTATPLSLSNSEVRVTNTFVIEQGPVHISAAPDALAQAWSAGHRNIVLASGATYTLTAALIAVNQQVVITGNATIIQASNESLISVTGTWEAEQTITEFVQVDGTSTDPEGDEDVALLLIAARVANAGLYAPGDRVKVIDDQLLVEERSTWFQGEFAIVKSVDTTTNLVTFASRLRNSYSAGSNARMARISSLASIYIGPEVVVTSTLPDAQASPAALVVVDGVYRPQLLGEVNKAVGTAYSLFGCVDGVVSARYGNSPNGVVVSLSSCTNFDVTGVVSGPCRHVVMPIIGTAPSGSVYSSRGYASNNRTRGSLVSGAASTPFDTHHGTENCIFYGTGSVGCAGGVQLRGRNHTVDGHVSFRDARGFSVFVQSGSAFTNTRTRNNTIRNFRCIEPTSGELGRINSNALGTRLEKIYYTGPTVAANVTSAVLWFEEAASIDDFDFTISATTTFASGLRIFRFGATAGMEASFRNGRVKIDCSYPYGLFRTTASSNKLIFENITIDCLSGADAPTTIFGGTLAAGSRIGNVTISNLNGTFFTNYTYDQLRPFLTGPVRRLDTSETWAPTYRIDSTGAILLPVPETPVGVSTNGLYFDGTFLKRASALEALFSKWSDLGVPPSSALRNVILTRWEELLQAGIASRFGALFVFGIENSIRAPIDWINPNESVTLVQPTTAITHAKGTGYGFNGVDNYITLPRQLANMTPYSQNSASLYLDVSAGTSTGTTVGLATAGTGRLTLRPTNGTNFTGRLNGSADPAFGANTTVAGRYLITRTDGTNMSGYKNGTLVGTVAQAAGSPANQTPLVAIGGNTSSFVNHTINVVAIGSGMNDVAVELDTIMAALMADIAALP